MHIFLLPGLLACECTRNYCVYVCILSGASYRLSRRHRSQILTSLPKIDTKALITYLYLRNQIFNVQHNLQNRCYVNVLFFITVLRRVSYRVISYNLRSIIQILELICQLVSNSFILSFSRFSTSGGSDLNLSRRSLYLGQRTIRRSNVIVKGRVSFYAHLILFSEQHSFSVGSSLWLPVIVLILFAPLYTIESWCSLDLTMDFHVFIKTCLSAVDVLFVTFRISRRILRLFLSFVMCVYHEKLLSQTTAKI